MHNLLGYDGTWRDAPHLGDHVGRALWALGTAAGAPNDSRDRARRLLGKALPLLARTESLRTVAYATLGLSRCGDLSAAAHTALSTAADRLQPPFSTTLTGRGSNHSTTMPDCPTLSCLPAPR